jgi:hypothetical protein
MISSSAPQSIPLVRVLANTRPAMTARMAAAKHERNEPNRTVGADRADRADCECPATSGGPLGGTTVVQLNPLDAQSMTLDRNIKIGLSNAIYGPGTPRGVRARGPVSESGSSS